MYEVILISISFLFGAGFALALQAMLKKKVDAPMPLPDAIPAIRELDAQDNRGVKCVLHRTKSLTQELRERKDDGRYKPVARADR